MKTILSLVGLFLAVIIFGTIFGFSATLLFIHATDIVVGADSVRLDMNQTLFLLFLWIGAAAVTSSAFTVVYSIRYPKNGIARVITHTILCLLAWVVIIPLSLECADKAGKLEPMQPKDRLMTASYFRPHDGKVYYYTSVNAATKTANGVSFTLNSLNNASDESQLLENAPLMKSNILPFSDVLIYNTMSRSKLVKLALPALYLNQQAAVTALKGGVLSWLTFASWGLALCTLIGVRRLFRWRLLNFIAVQIGFIAICAINLYYSWGWNGNLFGFVTIPSWIMNCIIAAVLSCIGILLSIFRPDPNMEHVE